MKVIALLCLLFLSYGMAHNLPEAPYLLVSREFVEPHVMVGRNLTVEAKIYNLGEK
jgi:hypothetical protein